MESVVAVIFSNWTLSEIFTFLEDYLDASKAQIGSARIEKYRTKDGKWKESNRTIILMDKKLYNEAINKDLGEKQPKLDFRIEEYKLSEHHYPKEGYKDEIFLNFPKEIPYKDIEIQIKERLKRLKLFGLLQYNNYRLIIPLESRETGEHKGFGYLKLGDEDEDNKAQIRLLLHDSRLYNDRDPSKHYYIKAKWAKKK